MGTRDRMWRAALPALLALACVVSARGHTQGEVQRAVVKDLHADDTEVAQNVIDALERRLLDVHLAKRDRRELGESATAGKLSKRIIRVIGVLVSQEIKAQCFPQKKQPIVVSTVVKGDRTYIDLQAAHRKIKQEERQIRQLNDKLGLANWNLKKNLVNTKARCLADKKALHAKHQAALKGKCGAIGAENRRLVKSTVHLEGRLLQCEKKHVAAQQKLLAQGKRITKHAQEMKEARAEISLNKRLNQENMGLKLKLKAAQSNVAALKRNAKAGDSSMMKAAKIARAAFRKKERSLQEQLEKLRKQLASEKKRRTVAEKERNSFQRSLSGKSGKVKGLLEASTSKHRAQMKSLQRQLSSAAAKCQAKVKTKQAKCVATMKTLKTGMCGSFGRALSKMPVMSRLSAELAGRLQTTETAINKLFVANGGRANHQLKSKKAERRRIAERQKLLQKKAKERSIKAKVVLAKKKATERANKARIRAEKAAQARKRAAKAQERANKMKKSRELRSKAATSAAMARKANEKRLKAKKAAKRAAEKADKAKNAARRASRLRARRRSSRHRSSSRPWRRHRPPKSRPRKSSGSRRRFFRRSRARRRSSRGRSVTRKKAGKAKCIDTHSGSRPLIVRKYKRKKYTSQCAYFKASSRCRHSYFQKRCQRTCVGKGKDDRRWSRPYFGFVTRQRKYKSRCAYHQRRGHCKSSWIRRNCQRTCLKKGRDNGRFSRPYTRNDRVVVGKKTYPSRCAYYKKRGSCKHGFIRFSRCRRTCGACHLKIPARYGTRRRRYRPPKSRPRKSSGSRRRFFRRSRARRRSSRHRSYARRRSSRHRPRARRRSSRHRKTRKTETADDRYLKTKAGKKYIIQMAYFKASSRCRHSYFQKRC